jgi:hypothetical protein
MKWLVKFSLLVAAGAFAGTIAPQAAAAAQEDPCRTPYVATLLPGLPTTYYCKNACCNTPAGQGGCCEL